MSGLNTRVTRIDTGQRAIELADGSQLSYGALLLATGAEPVRLDVPGANLDHVHYLRTLDDSRALIAKAEQARRAVIVGASFIGLEVASSLRARGLESMSSVRRRSRWRACSALSLGRSSARSTNSMA